MEVDLLSVVKNAQKGNEVSQGELYELYVDRIYRFVYLRTNHKQTAEDLTSDIFFKVFRAINSFDSEKGNFTSWIYTIARNKIIDHYRAGKETVDLEAIAEMPSSTSIPEETENRMILEKVKSALKELSEKDQEIIILRVWDGLSHREIAELVSSSEAAVKVAYLRAMRRLQASSVSALILLLTIKL